MSFKKGDRVTQKDQPARDEAGKPVVGIVSAVFPVKEGDTAQRARFNSGVIVNVEWPLAVFDPSAGHGKILSHDAKDLVAAK